MNKQFVTYEIALKLKELGFDEKCFALYDAYQHNRLVYLDEDGKNSAGIIKTNKSMEISSLAPLWQEAIDWLETKGYYINITRVFRWNPLPVEFSGWCVFIGTENPEEILECNSYYVNHFYSTKYEAREQAILKAIELIKEKQ